MSVNLIESAKDLFNSSLISNASAHLGETESGISKAVSGIVPAVFGGLLQKTSEPNGANTVAQMVREQHNSGILGNLGNIFSSGGGNLLNQGSGLLGGLFGGKTDLLSNLLSSFAGIRSSSAGSLLSMALPAILALIGRHAPSAEPGAISSLLSSQRDHINAAIPPGLNLGGILGNLGSHSGAKVVSGAHTAATEYARDTVKTGSSASKYVLPILVLAVLAIAAYYLMGKGCNNNKESTVVSSSNDSVSSTTTSPAADMQTTPLVTTGHFDSSTNDFVYDQGQPVTIDLHNNAGRLQVGEFSTENRLYKFLSDPGSVIDTVKGNWFEFTNVKFNTGSASITDASMTQLKNLVAISKGFPTAQFKIGGYTDNSGDAKANITLSQRRADAVAAMLKKLGAANTAIASAKGYGPEWPVADNGTPEGRAQNRRVAVNVKSK